MIVFLIDSFRGIAYCGIFERQHFINDDCLYITKLTVSHEKKRERKEDKAQNSNNGNMYVLNGN